MVGLKNYYCKSKEQLKTAYKLWKCPILSYFLYGVNRKKQPAGFSRT